MTDADLEPLVVYDVRENSWKGLTPGRQDQIREWARGQGIELKDTCRIEIYPASARITNWRRGEDGQIVVVGDEPVRGAPYVVPLTSLPPGVEAPR